MEDNQSRVMVQWLLTRGRLAFSSPTCLVVEEGAAAAAAAALPLVPSPAAAAPGAHIIDVVGAAPDSASQFSLPMHFTLYSGVIHIRRLQNSRILEPPPSCHCHTQATYQYNGLLFGQCRDPFKSFRQIM